MAAGPRRTETRIVKSYPFLEVREHDVEEDGVPPRTVVTIHLEDWAIVAAVTPEGKYVLVEQSRYGIDAPSLELAGGIVDPGETPVEAARRELLEETGYSAKTLVPLGWVHPNPALHDNRAFFFLAEGAVKIAEPEDHGDERLERSLWDESRLEVAIATSRITHALAVLGIMRARAHRAAQKTDTDPSTLRLLDQMEAHQRARVVSLARRLRPDLTSEDLASPHDFPELDDPDWHFEDGQLAAIQAVRYALANPTRDREPDAKET